MSVVLSVPDILANCPKKLIKFYPKLAKELEFRKKAKKAGLKPQFIPKPPVLVIQGSRLGGKSQFAFRCATSLILDGYAQSAMLATITEEGSKDSAQLLDKIFEEAEEPIVFSRESERPVRILSNGEPFYIEYLNKVDSKARQNKADILILEELEKWNESAGNTALYTMIRHFDCFIVLSNQLPRWAKVFFDTFNAEYVRIDYWENEALEPAIKEALEEKRRLDPEGWARDVMYQPTGGANRVFTERSLNNLFLKPPTEFKPIITILSIDCGAGGADNSVVFRLDMDKDFVIRAHLLMDESIAPEPLCQRIASYKVQENASEEVWDANGVGGAIMQFRSPKEEWNKRGIIPHVGKAINEKMYYNARAEAYMITADTLQRASLRVTGLSIQQQEELSLEIRSTTFRETEEARTNNTFRIEKKAEIKKRLGGLSPNKLDALCIGVWRLLTFHKNNIKIDTIGYSSTPQISGVPSLE